MPLPLEVSALNSIAARARGYAERFCLPLKDRNWRGGSGDYAGSGAGSSLDFQDHRAYAPGDDPRHINWQAYARTEHYTLKLYREEVRPVVEVLLDVSDSMFSEPEKANRALELFYFAVASAEKSGATFSVVLLKGERWKAIETGAVLSHRWRTVAADLPATAASAPLHLGAVPLRPRSLRVLVSDLLFPSNPEPLLRSLLREGGRAVLLAPFTAGEATPDWSGNYEFVETESGTLHQRRIDRRLLNRYREAYRDHFGRWKAASLRAQAPVARVPSEPPFETALKFEAIPAGALHLA